MKRFFLSLASVLALTVGVAPNANADTVTFPCGPNLQMYSVLMPQGVLLDGRKCSGTLNIDDSVKIIGVEAFKDAKLLEVKLPAGLELISASAFENTLLKKISIPSSVEIIGDSAFAYNDSLAEALIPNSVKSIGAQAFNGTRLLQINIPGSLTRVQSCAFANIDYGGGSRTIVIPSSVTSIEGCAFWNSGITSVAIPDSVTYLAGFSRNKISTVAIPNSVTTIGMNAFSNNPLISVQIPGSVTTIEGWAFRNTYLSDVVVPSSVRVIQDWAFASNLRLKSISIPDNLESLGKNVFDDSLSLQTIYYCGELTGFPISTICPPERREIIEKEKAAKLAAELKAKQEAEAAAAKATAELKAKQDADAKAAANKKTTIICVKGKLTKTVTAIKPKCPTGYKLKK
jgi:hypothetical protein